MVPFRYCVNRRVGVRWQGCKHFGKGVFVKKGVSYPHVSTALTLSNSPDFFDFSVLPTYFLWAASHFWKILCFLSACFGGYCPNFFICPRLVVDGAPPKFLNFFLWSICFYGGIYMPSNTPSHSLTCQPLPLWLGPLPCHASAGVPPFRCVVLTCQRIFQFFHFAKGRPLLWFGALYLKTINRSGTVWRWNTLHCLCVEIWVDHIALWGSVMRVAVQCWFCAA